MNSCRNCVFHKSKDCPWEGTYYHKDQSGNEIGICNGWRCNEMKRLSVCDMAGDIQSKLIDFVHMVNDNGIGCMSREIEADGNMLIFYDEKTWQKFVDVFDILGFDFTTGEPDGEYKTWYIDFEFSDGISE